MDFSGRPFLEFQAELPRGRVGEFDSDLTEEFAEAFFELRRHKGVDRAKARAAVETPPVYAAMLVRSGRATGTVGGAVHTTGEIVRAAIQVIGMAPDAGMVSLP